MAVTLKRRDEIELLRQANRVVMAAFAAIEHALRPGVSLLELDRVAEAAIRRQGATPAYKHYQPHPRQPPFPATICASVNEVICHGIPSARKLREGDIVGIDIGAAYRGYYGDACITYAVGHVSPAAARLLEVAREALDRGVAAAQPGARLGDIGAAIQGYVEPLGFSVVRKWGGHGIGRRLHEEPSVMHYGRAGTGLKLLPGMVITIEPMINAGSPESRTLDDAWTEVTVDGSLSAQFEHSLVIGPDGPEILTMPI